MRTIAALLLLSSSAYAQSAPPSPVLNSATVNVIGNYQNIIINQTGANHSTNLNLIGDNIPVTVNQSGLTPQSFSLSVTCFSSCASSPYIINQY